MPDKSKGLIIILGALAALGAAAIDMYLPSLPRIETELAPGSGLAQLTLGAFLIGLGVGQLFHGAISDAYGRRWVLIGGTALYCLASLGCITASDINELIAWRFVQAFGAASGGVIARAIVRDLYSMDEGARAQSFINMAFLVTPLLAPNIGGYLLTWFGWRSIFVLLSLFGALCLIALIRWLPESLPPERRTPLSPGSLLRGYARILSHRQALGCLLASTFSFACMFTFFAGSPFIYITYFGVPEQHYGLLFGLNVIGIITTNGINARLVVRIGAIRLMWIGCAICAAGSLMLATMTFFSIGGLWGVVVPLFFVIGSLGLIGANALAGAMEPFPTLAATTASLLGFSRMILGAAMGALLGIVHDGTPLPMGLLIGGLGGLSLLSCCLLLRRRQTA
ncbi:MAG: DHA1 family bicyclomycin/chloramphenicol resistance-like MFS transporter [Gammaproteobacteria bacterium]|jgi:DHA1 family bicyclomycin/chloramphenicol resistance-like MFS transporter